MERVWVGQILDLIEPERYSLDKGVSLVECGADLSVVLFLEVPTGDQVVLLESELEYPFHHGELPTVSSCEDVLL